MRKLITIIGHSYLKRMTRRTQAEPEGFVEGRLSVMPAYPCLLLDNLLLSRDVYHIYFHI